MRTVSDSEVREMNIDERLDLIERVWNSIVEEQPYRPLSAWEKDELDRRLDDHLEDPDDVVAWEHIKSDLQPHP